MRVLLYTMMVSLLLASLTAYAAGVGTPTGITSLGPAGFLFTIAFALMLTLVLRSTVSHFTNLLVARHGRRRVERVLKKRGKDVLDDFILPGAYGGLVRIDHALLTAGGILCIRTVHFNGIVFGGENEAQWTNVDGPERRRFLNPIIQNEGRARALRQIVPDVPVANLVVCTGNIEFPTPPPKNVIRVGQLNSFIQKYVFGPSKVEDWDSVWLSVKSAARTDEATRRDLKAQVGFG
ncbi:MAG: nuclease-related domain-containing protein [Pseudomonadota bacterium]